LFAGPLERLSDKMVLIQLNSCPKVDPGVRQRPLISPVLEASKAALYARKVRRCHERPGCQKHGALIVFSKDLTFPGHAYPEAVEASV